MSSLASVLLILICEGTGFSDIEDYPATDLRDDSSLQDSGLFQGVDCTFRTAQDRAQFLDTIGISVIFYLPGVFLIYGEPCQGAELLARHLPHGFAHQQRDVDFIYV